MNRTKSTYFKAALASALLLMASADAWSQSSPVVYYHGFLKNDRGEPVSGSFSLKFSLHNAASGGTELWTETLTAPVENGLLTAALGTQQPLTAVFSSGQQRWLELSLRVSGSTGPFTTLSPRQAVGSSPQAMFALNAGAHNHSAGDITSGGLSPARGGLGIDLSGAAEGSLLYASAPGMWSVLSPGNKGQLVGMTGSGLLGWANVLSVLQAGPGIVLDPPDLNVDPSGRVRVRFHWDSSGIADQESTWSRIQHFPAGVSYGINFLPEINDEVLVTFLNGDPDRPLVLGQLFNNPDNPARHGPSRKIKAGDATGPNRDGGSIFLEPGRGTGTGTDGSVTLSSPVEIRFVPQGASLWARHSEDTVQLQAELVAPAGDRPGQSVEIRASDAAGANRNGGDIVLQPGVATGAGARGRVRIMGDLSLPTSGITGGGAASGLDADTLDGFSWHDHPLFRGLNLTDWAAPGPAGGGFPGLRLRGTLSDPQGALREGLVTVTVRIYSVATGGTPLYAEQFTALLVAGVVDLVLGVGSGTATGELVAALTPAPGQPAERYLALHVEGDTQELMPRRRVTAGAYAIVALNAQSLGGQPASAYVARIDLDAEVAARVAADAALQAVLDAEVAARIAGDAAAVTSARTYTDTAVTSEAAARVAADTTLQTALDAEVAARVAGDAAAVTSARTYTDGAVASELAARIAGDAAAVASAKTYTDTTVASEAAARIAADTSLQTALDAEVAARIAGDAAAVTSARTYTDTAIATEVAARAAGDAAAVASAKTYTDTTVASEAAARIAADTSLQTALDAEVAARVAGDAAAVTTARTYTDTAVASEATARVAADAILSGNLDTHKTSGDHDARYPRLAAANSFTALQDFKAGLRLDTAEIQAGPPAPDENRLRYTLFKEDGTPLRAEIKMTIQNVSAREMPLSSSVQYRIACTGADDHGPHFLLTAGDGVGTDKNGGHTILEGGSPTGAGIAGSVIARQNAVGAVNAPIFAVQNSSGAATYLQVAGSGQVSWSGTAQGSIAGNAATATTAGTATTLAGGTHSGQYTFDNAANTYRGNGSALTSLNAASLADGTVAAARGGIGIDTSSAAPGSILRTTAPGTWETLPAGTPGQVLKMAGGLPAWGTDETGGGGGGGTVTSIAAGTGIASSPNPITTSGTIAIDTAVVPRKNVANTFTDTTTFQPAAPGSVSLVVQGAASQTASLQEWRNSAGVSVASVSSSGTFMGDGSGLTSLTASALANHTSYNIGTGAFQAGTLSGTHSGNGSGLTGVTAATLAGGTHTGQYTFDNVANSFSGSFSGGSLSGTHSGDGAGLTGVTPADNSVSTAKLQEGCVTGAKLSAAGCTAGQVWKFNGTGWTCADDNDTTYSAGAGLNLSGTTFSLADGGVTTAKLADAAVTGAKLASTLTVSGALTLATSGNGNSLTLQTAAGANSTENVSVTADENIQLTAVNGAITVNKPVTGAAAKAGTASAAETPSAANLTVLRLDGYSVPTTITDLLDGVDGQTLVIVAGNNALPVIVSDNDSPTPGNFRLRGNLVWQAIPNHTLSLCRMNGIWFETGRSEN